MGKYSMKLKPHSESTITLNERGIFLTLTVPLSFEAFEGISCSLGTAGEVRNPLSRLKRLRAELSDKLDQEIESAICKMLKNACLVSEKRYRSKKR